MGKFREHTIDEKRKLRNARQKRKRQKRAKERKNSQEAKLRKEYANRILNSDKLRSTATLYCRRWKDQCSESKRLRELLHKHEHCQTGNLQHAQQNRSTFKHVCPTDLLPVKGSLCLGEGSFGKCFLRTHKRLNIPVVEKQMPTSSEIDIIKEAQTMQLLSHSNIPIILGVQLQQKPFSIVMEFVGEGLSSRTVHEYLRDDTTLDKRDWVKISFNVADALAHLHKKDVLHCDLKANNILISNKQGYLIDFGKACPIKRPPAKKYKKTFPHIAPEVLNGSPCSTKSDIYSLGTVLEKIGSKKQISVICNLAEKCLINQPSQRITLIGLMTTLTTQTEVPLKSFYSIKHV